MVNLALLVGRIAFLALLYLFIYLVVRSATRDLRSVAALRVAALPGPGAVDLAAGSGSYPDAGGTGGWALVVEQSPYARVGWAFVLPPKARMVAGRAADTDIHLPDTFVSAHHSRMEARDDGLLVEDLGSTNGTFVNGEEIEHATLAGPGDVVAVGDTVFRVESR